MNKSDFYKQWYSTEKGKDLNSDGYPPCGFQGEEITTEEQWTKFLELEPELDDFKRLDERACEILGGTWEVPYEWARVYPDIGDQLDKLYHDVDAGKFGADAKTSEWFASVKKVKDDFPKN
mgnify:FL=1|tara:strand:+ start:686 stop:1048 length:363 start_codon:yes stop_codon:yes gene_type:complete